VTLVSDAINEQPARTPIRFGVVDLETSGLVAGRHRILQIGVVVVEDGQIVDSWSTMVRLRWPLQRTGPRHIHGITRRHLRGAPKVADALAELSRRLDGAIFTAHNAAFDATFLEMAAEQAGVELHLRPRLCTLRLSRRLDPDRSLSHRLGDLCERYDVSLDRPHDALADAIATAHVLPHLLEAHGIEQLEQLEPFYDRR
jgi:DNA polymerase III epsilon subunit-like protein